MRGMIRPAKRLHFSIALLIALLFDANLNHFIYAQTPVGANAVIQVYDKNAQNFVLHAFAPGDPNGTILTNLGAYQSGDISVDGAKFVAYGRLATTTAPLIFGTVGQPGLPINVTADTTVMSASLSQNEGYLFYTLSDSQGWTLGFLRLADNVAIELTGKPQAEPGDKFGGLPLALALNSDASKLYITDAILGGGEQGIYSVDLSGINRAQSGRYALPATMTLVNKGIPYSGNHFKRSPDNSKILFLTYDAASNLPNQQSNGQTKPYAANSLSVLDLSSGQVRIVRSATGQQIIVDATWLGDSQHVVYASANYDANGQLPTSTQGLQVLDLNTNQVADSGVLAAPVSYSSLIACANTVFFMTLHSDGQGVNQTLYSAPINDLKTWSAPLFQGNTLQLLPVCIQSTSDSKKPIVQLPDQNQVVPTLVKPAQVIDATVAVPQGVTASVISGTGILNIRTGPGTNYPIIGHLNTTDTVTLVGRNDAGSWYVIDFQGAQQGWITGDPQLVSVKGNPQTLSIIAAPPPPPPTAVPIAPVQASGVFVGGKAIITVSNVPLMSAPMEMTAGPNAPQPILMLAVNTVVDVVGGPASAWNTRWWQVRTADGVVGWAFERAGDAPGGSLLISPYTAQPTVRGAAGIKVGGKAQVSSGVTYLPMLAQPEANGPSAPAPVAILNGSEIVDVVGGPVSAWNTRWWQVRNGNNVVGWTFERAGDAPGGSDLLQVYP